MKKEQSKPIWLIVSQRFESSYELLAYMSHLSHEFEKLCTLDGVPYLNPVPVRDFREDGCEMWVNEADREEVKH